ncbi:MAG: hypothetical protein NXH88_07210 [Hyphomonas sp.]|nr:hypothetical protein [Hyphomonas sp.]
MDNMSVGGAKISERAASVPHCEMGEKDRALADAEVERQELSFRQFFSGDPIAAFESLHGRLLALEEALAGLSNAPEPHPAAAMLDQMEETKAKLDERPADPLEVSEEPPEGIADLFQADRPYADQAKALWDKYNELTQKIMMNLATDAERSKHAKLQGELDWIKHHVFEAV